MEHIGLGPRDYAVQWHLEEDGCYILRRDTTGEFLGAVVLFEEDMWGLGEDVWKCRVVCDESTRTYHGTLPYVQCAVMERTYKVGLLEPLLSVRKVGCAWVMDGEITWILLSPDLTEVAIVSDCGPGKAYWEVLGTNFAGNTVGLECAKQHALISYLLTLI